MTNNERFNIWNKFIDPRVDKLVRNKLYLEAFYLFFAAVEFILQANIQSQEEWILMNLHKRGVKFDPTPVSILQKKPLGELIKLFSRYCEDSDLIFKLNNFNSFRITTVHKLMDQDIDKLNLKAKSSLKSYHELIAKLSRYGLKISNKKIASFSRKIKNLERKRVARDGSI